jgi:ArsR family metal-binding transcriptional regulator
MNEQSQSNKQALVLRYDLELVSPPCHPGAATWSALASLDTEIDAVLPYLNARLERAEYDHQAKALIWKDQGRSFAFRSREIKAAPAHDREEARDLIERAVAMVNQTWLERERIEPRCDRRPRANLMQLYRLLPRSNCAKCGCSTCLAFSAGLLEGNKQLADCPDLTNRSGLQELLGLAVD